LQRPRLFTVLAASSLSLFIHQSSLAQASEQTSDDASTEASSQHSAKLTTKNLHGHVLKRKHHRKKGHQEPGLKGDDVDEIEPEEPGEDIRIPSEPSFFENVKDKVTLAYSGVYRGGSFSDFTSSYQPTATGHPDSTSPISLENLVTAGYRITPDWTIGAIAHLYYLPAGFPPGTGQALQNYDPSIYIARSKLVDYRGISLSGSLNWTFPVSSFDYLRPHHIASAITLNLVASLQAPKSHLRLGMAAYLRGYIPNGNAGNDVPTYKVYLGPNLSYQIVDNVAFTLFIDLVQAVRSRGTGFISGLKNPSGDIQPGIFWQITKNISINPLINIYPSSMSLASSSLQLLVFIKPF